MLDGTEKTDGTGGAVTVKRGSTTVSAGELPQGSYTLTAAAKSGYAFDGWYAVGGTTALGTGASYTVTLDKGTTIEARFHEKESVTVTGSFSGATVNYATTQNDAKKGTSLTSGDKLAEGTYYFYITPKDSSASVTSVTVNGVEKTLDSSSILQLTLNKTNCPNGVTLNVTTAGVVGEMIQGGSVTFTDSGWKKDTSFSGRAALASDSTNTNSDLVATVTVPAGGAYLTFDTTWSTTTGSTGNTYYTVLIDGTQKLVIGGNDMVSDLSDLPWTQGVFLLEAGTHTVIWRHHTDGNYAYGLNRAWVSNIRLESPSTVVDNGLLEADFDDTLGTVYATIYSDGASWTDGLTQQTLTTNQNDVHGQRGQRVRLIAEPKNGSYFAGWYVNGKLMAIHSAYYVGDYTTGYLTTLTEGMVVKAVFLPNAFNDVAGDDGALIGTGVDSVMTRDHFPWVYENGAYRSVNNEQDYPRYAYQSNGVTVKMDYYDSQYYSTNSYSALAVSVTGPGRLVFEYKTSKDWFDEFWLTEDTITLEDQHAGTIVVPDDAEAYTEYTYTVKGDAENTIYFIYYFRGGDGRGEGKAWIKNIKFYPTTETINVTYTAQEGGTITGVPSTTYAGARYRLLARPNSGYEFYGWIEKTTGAFWGIENELTFIASQPYQIEAVFAPTGSYAAGRGTEFYTDLAAALADARSGETVRMYQDATLTADATVPSGVTLLVPCKADDTGYQNEKYNYDNPDTANRKAVYRTLTIAEGATLTINGTLLVNSVSGRASAGHYDQDVTGGYGRVVVNGSIVVENGGLLDNFGYISGSGTVTAKSGGTIGDMYIVKNWRGGSQAYDMYSAGVYPMNEYELQNITVPVTIESGASYTGLVKMYASGSYYYTRFPQVDNANGLIRLADGAVLTKTIDNGREKHAVTGGAEFASSALNVVGMTLSTGDYVYPINGIYDFVLDNGEYTFAESFKFMPGATMTANSGANLTVNDGKTVVFYDSFKTADPANTDNTQYPSSRGAATLTLGEGVTFSNNGTFAGTIQTNTTSITGTKWSVTTREANGYRNGTRALSFTLNMAGQSDLWHYGTDNRIVWELADYTAVDDAIAAAGNRADDPGYTDASRAALKAAIAAVQRGRPLNQQSAVNDWAKAINDAVAALQGNVYTITFSVPVGATVAPASKTVTYGESYGTLPTPTRSGYIFDCWQDGSGNQVNATDLYKTVGDTVLTPKWTTGAYTITLDLNGGSITSDAYDAQSNGSYQRTFTVESNAITLPTPSREGHAFLGWTGSNGSEPQQTVTIPSGSTNSVSYTANWKTNEHAVKWMLTDSEAYKATTLAYGAAITAPETDPVREGYAFKGWANYAGTMPDNDVTVAAQWDSYLEMLIALDIDDSTLATARKYYAKLNDTQKSAYDTTDLFAAIKAYEAEQVEAAAAAAVPNINSGSLSGIAELKLNGKNADGRSILYVELTNMGKPAREMLNNGFLRDLFSYDGVDSIKVSDSEPISKTAQFAIMLEIAWQTIAGENGYTDKAEFENWLRAQQETMTVGILAGTGVAANLVGRTAEGVDISVPYMIYFYEQGKQPNENAYVTLTFDTTGGREITSIVKRPGTLISAPAAPEKTGYTFGGWIYENRTPFTFTDTTVMPTEGLTLYAAWTADTHTVSFDANGGSGTADAITVTYDSVYGTLPMLSRDGYTFDNWYLNGEKITAESIVKLVEDAVLKAEWTANTYTVTLEAKGGTVEPGSINVTYGETYGELPEPTRPGYTFDGWFNGNNTKITSGTTVSITGPQTLIAQWKAKTDTPYKVEHYQQDADRSGYTLTETERLFGTTDTATAAAAKGYAGFTAQNFTQESINGDGGTVVRINYDRNSYTVRFNANGGEGSMGDQSFACGAAQALEENTFARTGYTFSGWNTASDGKGTAFADKEAVNNLSEADGGTVTLYAQWVANTYTIRFDSDGGSEAEDITVTYDGTYGALPTPEKAGYTFTGWYNGAAQITSTTRVAVTGAQTLKAGWNAKGDTPYKVEHYKQNANGYALADTEELSGTTAATVTAGQNSYLGYHFSAGNAANISGGVVAADGGLTLRLYYDRNSYTVCFNANGGAGSMGDQSFTYDAEQALAKNLFTRVGYSFTGWNAASDGSGAAYADAASARNLSEEDGGTVTLYAQWAANMYIVTFDANGGSEADRITVIYDGTYGELPVPAKQGYVFAGWEDNAGKTVTAATTVSRAGDHALTAQWRPATDTAYRVEHYWQNVDGEGYDKLADTDEGTGTTNSEASASWNSYTGFRANEEKSTVTGTVAPDGSLVLRLYYDRESYTVTWAARGKTESRDYLYGTDLSDAAEVYGQDYSDDNGVYTFAGWDKTPVSVTEDVTYTAQYTKTYEAVIGTTTYRTLALALANAASGDTVVPVKEATLTENAAVPAGVTLLIPCKDGDTGYQKNGQNYDNPGVARTPSLYRTLTIPAGVTLTVNGTVLVNAVTGVAASGHYDQDVTGGYGRIVLNGDIVVNGVLDCFGYITGSGTVTAKSGGTVGDLYVVKNWRGGSQALEMYVKDVYPMNEYDCHNIETAVRIEADGNYTGLVKMYASGSYYFTRFPQISKTNGLIRLTDDDAYVLRTYDSANKRELYTISGGADFSRSTLNIVGMDLSTGSYIYPIDGDTSFELNDGTYRFTENFKFLPGSSVTVNNGASASVQTGKTVVFYHEFNDPDNTDGTQYPSDRAAAVLRLEPEGSFTNRGTFAGDIETTGTNIYSDASSKWSAETREANGYYATQSESSQYTVTLAHTLRINGETEEGSENWYIDGRDGSGELVWGERHVHSYGAPSYSWSADNKTVTAYTVCAGCGDEVTETVSTTYAVKTAPTATTAGEGAYTAKFENQLFTTQTKTVSIPATGNSGSGGTSGRVTGSAGETSSQGNTEKTPTSTETKTNSDGSTTTSISYNDGSKSEVTAKTESQPDGSVKETKSETAIAADGKVTNKETETIIGTDGSVKETATVTDSTGSTGTTVTENGKTTSATATLSTDAIAEARASTEAVTLPVTVNAARSTDEAATVSVTLPSTVTGSTKVEVPVPEVKTSVVAYVKNADGELELVKDCIVTQDGVALDIDGSTELVIVDNSKEFSDVSTDSWESDAVQFVTSREIFNGVSRSAFAPTAEMSRGMIAQVLFNFDRDAEAEDSKVFADASGKWYDDAANWAANLGVITGDNGRFMGDNSVLRQDLATMLYRYAQAKGYKTTSNRDLSGFSDADTVSDYASNAMNWAVSNGLISGTDKGLEPRGKATRAQVAAIMQRFCEKIR